MSSSDDDALKRASALSRKIAAASHRSCRDADDHIRASKKAIVRSFQLLSLTIQPARHAGTMEAAE